MSGREDAYVELAKTARPVQVVFGDRDTTIPPCLVWDDQISSETGASENNDKKCTETIAQRMQSIMPSADVRMLSDADHGLNYKDFEIINPWMIEFFSPMLGAPAAPSVEEALANPGE